MKRTPSLSAPLVGPSSAAVRTAPLEDASRIRGVEFPTEMLPGRDTRCDGARHYVAVGVLAVAMLGTLGVGAGIYLLGGGEANAWARGADARQAGFEADSFGMMGIAADMPTLRPSLGSQNAGILLFDGATGRNALMDAPADGSQPAANSAGIASAPTAP